MTIPSMPPVRLATLILGTAATVACSDADADSGAVEAVVRDSAGVTIVENPLPPDSGGALALAAEPDVTIGVLEGAPEYQLFQANAALRLSDGRIAVLNAGTHEIRYYSPDGRYLNAVGRQGEGPGEFKGMADMWRLEGDSLLVFDWDTRRLTLIDDQGRFVRTHNPQRGDGFAWPLGMLDSDRMLLRGSVTGQMQDMKEGIQRDSADFHLLSWREHGGEMPEPALRTPGGEWFLARMQTGTSSMTMYMPLLFGSVPSTTAAHGHIYQGVAHSYRIEVYDAGGALQRVITRAHERLPATAEMRERAVQSQLDAIDDENRRRTQAQIYEKMPLPQSLPAHSRIMVDAAARLWVQRYDPLLGRLGESTVGATWDVYDEGGRWIATIPTPPNVGLRDIGPDYVLAMHHDDMGVEQVRLYRLVERGEGE